MQSGILWKMLHRVFRTWKFCRSHQRKKIKIKKTLPLIWSTKEFSFKWDQPERSISKCIEKILVRVGRSFLHLGTCISPERKGLESWNFFYVCTFMGRASVESFMEITCIMLKIDFGGVVGCLNSLYIPDGCDKTVYVHTDTYRENRVRRVVIITGYFIVQITPESIEF